MNAVYSKRGLPPSEAVLCRYGIGSHSLYLRFVGKGFLCFLSLSPYYQLLHQGIVALNDVPVDGKILLFRCPMSRYDCCVYLMAVSIQL